MPVKAPVQEVGRVSILADAGLPEPLGRILRDHIELGVVFIFPTLRRCNRFYHVGCCAPSLFSRLVEVAICQILPASSEKIARHSYVARGVCRHRTSQCSNSLTNQVVAIAGCYTSEGRKSMIAKGEPRESQPIPRGIAEPAALGDGFGITLHSSKGERARKRSASQGRERPGAVFLSTGRLA